MKNKIVKLTSILIVITYLTSCTNKSMISQSNKVLDEDNEMDDTIAIDIDDEKESNNSGIQKSENINKNSEDKQEKVDDIKGTEYKVMDGTYIEEVDNRNINIKFPQITGLVDEDNEKEINSLLKAEALKVLSYYEDDYSKEQHLNLDIKYSISLSNKYILSVQYFGLGELEKAPRPHKLFYTTNIDINLGKKLRLVELLNLDKELANMLFNAEFTPIAAPEETYVLKEDNTYEEVKASFISADNVDKTNSVFTFFTDESFVISVPALDALGGSAELKIKYQDLTKYLSDVNNEIKEFVTSYK